MDPCPRRRSDLASLDPAHCVGHCGHRQRHPHHPRQPVGRAAQTLCPDRACQGPGRAAADVQIPGAAFSEPVCIRAERYLRQHHLGRDGGGRGAGPANSGPPFADSFEGRGHVSGRHADHVPQLSSRAGHIVFGSIADGAGPAASAERAKPRGAVDGDDPVPSAVDLAPVPQASAGDDRADSNRAYLCGGLVCGTDCASWAARLRGAPRLSPAAQDLLDARRTLCAACAGTQIDRGIQHGAARVPRGPGQDHSAGPLGARRRLQAVGGD